jgi:hypothetical protein
MERVVLIVILFSKEFASTDILPIDSSVQAPGSKSFITLIDEGKARFSSILLIHMAKTAHPQILGSSCQTKTWKKTLSLSSQPSKVPAAAVA